MKKASTAPEEHTHNRADETVYLEKERERKKKKKEMERRIRKKEHLI
jgi:hypothetical protein